MQPRRLVPFLVSGLSALGCDTLKSVQDGAKGGLDQVKAGEDLTKAGKEQADSLKGGKAVGGGGSAAAGAGEEDNTRITAKESKPNEVITDDVGLKKTDPVDWKRFDLPGNPGLIKVKVHWDDPSTELNVDLYDAFGENVAASPGKQREPQKTLLAQGQPGLYYVRIQPTPLLKGTSPGTVYTMRLDWKGAPATKATAAAPAQVPPPGAQVPPPGGVPPSAPAAPGAPGDPAANPKADDPMHPRCKVVQSYRDEDGSMVLFLDRGGAAGFKVGMTGTLLLGKEGDAPLDGGDFRITSVIDAQKAKAKGVMATVGKNNRARVDLVKLPPHQ